MDGENPALIQQGGHNGPEKIDANVGWISAGRRGDVDHFAATDRELYP
jgi:hypothetical protein